MLFLRSLGVVVVARISGLAWDGRAGAQAEPFSADSKSENLKAFFQRLHIWLVHVPKDAKRRAALFLSLIPIEDRLKKLHGDDVPDDILRRLVQEYQKTTIREANAPKLVRPEETSVQVHAAGTAQLTRYEKDALVEKECPEGGKGLPSRSSGPA